MRSLLLFSVLLLFSAPLIAKNAEKTLEKVRTERELLATEHQEVLDKIHTLEEALEVLARQQTERAAVINELQNDISEKMPLFVRFGRIHPLQLLVNPASGKNSLRSMIMVHALTSSLKAQLAQLQGELEQMAKFAIDMQERRDTQQQLLKKLETQMAKLKAVENEKMAELKTKAQTIEELAEEEDVNVLLEESRATLSKQFGNARKAATLKNLPFSRLRPPSSGKQIQDPTLQAKFSPQSEGIIFQAKMGEVIIAPAAGKVAFKGPFRNQKEILIIDHGKKVHSVLMGMDIINAEIGQSVYTGEKIGKMASYGSSPPNLYYELRQGGKTVAAEAYMH